QAGAAGPWRRLRAADDGADLELHGPAVPAARAVGAGHAPRRRGRLHPGAAPGGDRAGDWRRARPQRARDDRPLGRRAADGGCYTAYLEFEDGTPATLVYSGYGHFDSAELHYWVGERGQMRDPATHAETRRAYQARAGGAADEAASREAIR